MRPKDVPRGAALSAALQTFHDQTRPLPGIHDQTAADSLAEQIVESIRRVEYIGSIHRKPLSAECANPESNLFDPLKAASVLQRLGEIDEACWLVFLSVHFGRHRTAGWQLSRDVYGALGAHLRWTWIQTSGDPDAFDQWLQTHENELKPDGVVRFGNHRKYESIGAGSKGTAAVIRSYIDWVRPHRSHVGLVKDALDAAAGSANEAFDHLFRSMQNVMRFGRTARFDYLTMLGKLDLAPIAPGIPYLMDSTGPLRGARLLFGGGVNVAIPTGTLDLWVAELGEALGAGMQVMEDALCNWQKHPDRFVPFRG